MNESLKQELTEFIVKHAQALGVLIYLVNLAEGRRRAYRYRVLSENLLAVRYETIGQHIEKKAYLQQYKQFIERYENQKHYIARLNEITDFEAFKVWRAEQSEDLQALSFEDFFDYRRIQVEAWEQKRAEYDEAKRFYDDEKRLMSDMKDWVQTIPASADFDADVAEAKREGGDWLNRFLVWASEILIYGRTDKLADNITKQELDLFAKLKNEWGKL